MSDEHDAAPSTAGRDYAERLERLETARWKQALDVQRPYRWNLRRLARGRVLDVGCGIGRNLVGLDDAVGVDHNADSIAVARSRGLTAYSTDEWADAPDARPESFDTMLLAHVLEHMGADDADGVVRSYLPYLKPEARLILICPQEKGWTTDPTHVRFVDPAELRRSAESVGFTPVRSLSFPFPRAAGKVFAYNEFVLVADRRA